MAKKIMTYLPLVLMAIVAIASLSFAEVERATLRCTDVVISIEKNAAHSDFVTEDDVYEMIGSNRNMLIGREITDFDIAEIESLIEDNPITLNCETYFTIKGEMNIKVRQRTPVIRVVAQNSEFYIDENGVEMPLSERASARVLVASGEIADDYQPNFNILSDDGSKLLQDIFTLTNKIRNDEMFLPIVEQIYVTKKQEFILGSKVGPARIEFGTIDGCDEKLKHLKAFFNAEKVRENWQQYKSLSLKFKNQIVCTKK